MRRPKLKKDVHVFKNSNDKADQLKQVVNLSFIFCRYKAGEINSELHFNF